MEMVMKLLLLTFFMKSIGIVSSNGIDTVDFKSLYDSATNQVRKDIPFNVTVSFNITADPGNYSLTVELRKPYSDFETCTESLWDGQATGSCSSDIYSDVNWLHQIPAYISAPTSTLADCSFEDSDRIQLTCYFEYLIVGSTLTKSLEIYQEASVTSSSAANFTVELELYDLNGDIVVNSTSEAISVTVQGPFIDGTTTSSDNGNETEFVFVIDHDDDSTEDASNLIITRSKNNANTYPIIYGEFDPSTGTPDTDVVNNETFTIDTFAKGDTLEITYTIDLSTEPVQLDVPYCIVLSLEWEDSTGADYSEDVYACMVRPVSSFNDVGAQNIPAELSPGQQFSVERTFDIPEGIMNDVELVIEVTIGDIETISISVTSDPDLTGPSSSDAVIQQPDSDWQVTRRRRDLSVSRHKRASGAWTLTAPLGTVQNTGSPSLSFDVSVGLTVGSLANGGTGVGAVRLQYNGVSKLMSYNGNLLVSVPVLTISKTASMLDDSVRPNVLQFDVTVEHSPLSNADAHGVRLLDGASYMDIDFQDGFVPGLGSVSVTDDTYITYTEDPLAQGDSMVLSYKAKTNDDFPDSDKTYYDASVRWYPTSSQTSGTQQTSDDSACLERDEVVVESVLYQHGFTVLGLICGILAGALIGVLIVFIIWICRRKLPCAGGVGPMFGGMEGNTDTGLVTSVSETMKRGYVDIRNLSKVGANDSIVMTLAQKDKIKQNREMDNMDIMGTISVDEDIEKERNSAMIKATHALVAGLRINGDITKGTQEKCTGKFQKNLANMEKNLNNEYKKEMEDVFKRMSMKNKAKLAEMQERQKIERRDLDDKLRSSDMTEQEKNELRKLQQTEHQVETEDVNYRLKLEQDEEAEKLRKEYSVRRRIGLKSLQQDFLDDVTKEGKLTDQEQVDWLMKEHYKNQSTLETMYDDEISRQRVLLEEKLARRRALAQKTELQEEAHSDLLNSIASQHLDTIKKTKKGGNLSASEAKQMVAEAQENMMEIKNKMDADRERQEKALHERLSQRKRDKMQELAKRQQQELNDLDKKINSAMQGEGVDPIGAVQSRQQLVSNQRAEKSELENEVDREHAKELEKLREGVAQKMKEDLQEAKEKDMQELTQYGLSDKEMHKMLKKHDKELEELEARQAEDRANQEANFKTKLAAQRKEWSRRKQKEREEQQSLREHEENVVQRLMDNQVAMSEDERTKIMQEHEKQMVKMENSLTLNKLSQKRMLEERLAKRKNQQMEKLEKKQLSETRKSGRGGDADSDEEDVNEELALMKKHAEQRIAVMQGEKISLDNELDDIREAMTKERVTALQEQEVKIAAMLADLQMAKAREMAKIEEQQKAIFDLKANLMDDLNEKGVLSDPECQRVIKIHQEEQEKLNSKLDSQRAKQEQILRRKLEERLKSKEAQMSRMQESEIRDRMGPSVNTPAGKIRRAALLSKHMLEVEKFRNRMDKEINQTLEELRRQNEIRRMNMIQEQDLQFINGLVRLGKFDKAELENVVAMLFPTKPEEERKAMLAKMMEGYQAPPPDTKKGGKGAQPPQSKGLSRRTSTLEQRVKSASIARGESASLQGSFRGKKKGKSRRSADPRYDEDFENYSYGNQRPEPIGRSYTPDQFGDQYDPDFDQSYGSQSRGYGRTPPSRLPPLEGSTGTATKKKKKKTRTEPIDEDF